MRSSSSPTSSPTSSSTSTPLPTDDLPTSMLALLTGEPITAAWLQTRLNTALANVGPVAPLPCGARISEVANVRLPMDGRGIVAQGQSMSAELVFDYCRVDEQNDGDGDAGAAGAAGAAARVGAGADAGAIARTMSVYIKRVEARRFARSKPPSSLRRDLRSAYYEQAFYRHVAPLLRAGDGGDEGGDEGEAGSPRRGPDRRRRRSVSIPIPTPIYVDERSYHNAALYSDAEMAESAYLLVLERVDPAAYVGEERRGGEGGEGERVSA